MSEQGNCEGDLCNRDGCSGHIETHPSENCSCHLSPPCASCTSPRNFCSECEWEEKDDPVEEYKPSEAEKASWEKYAKEMDERRNRPLDSTKIDYRIRSHSHISQICEGVYPEGSTREEVRKVVDGTFGGRFEKFGDGKFKFIAYTD